MMMIVQNLQSLLLNVGPFFLLLGLLIFVHESGHFLVARLFGVRVETFSLGFGTKLFSFKRGDTTYALSLIPLGGYVKMFGDDIRSEIPDSEKPYSFLHKPVWQRVGIVLAGPLMNLFFAILLFIAIGLVGEEAAGPFVGDVAEDSKAFESGFRSGDKILSINSKETPTWNHVRKTLEKLGGQAVQVVIERKGEAQPLTLESAVSVTENENIFSSTREVGHIPGLTQESRSTVFGLRDPNSPAAQGGLKSLEIITAVNGTKVTNWRDLQPALFAAFTQPDSQQIAIQVRELTKADKPENLRTVMVQKPATWDEKSDLPELIGIEPAELYIYQIKENSPASRAGLLALDKVIRINNDDVYRWTDVLNRVKSFDPTAEEMKVTVSRKGEEKVFSLKPEMMKLMTSKGQEEKRFTIGIVSGHFPSGPEPVVHRLSSPAAIIAHGFSETLNWSEFIVMSFVRLVQGDVSPKNIGGVITIGRVASHSFEAGLSTFLKTMAIISINLFLLNLLPVPVLDGGHLVFYAIEGLRGAPLSMRKMELAQQVGLMLLMFLMIFAFYNDMANFFFSRW